MGNCAQSGLQPPQETQLQEGQTLLLTSYTRPTQKNYPFKKHSLTKTPPMSYCNEIYSNFKY